MTEYLVFPIPRGLVKVKALDPEVARDMFRKEMPEFEDEEIIIIPTLHGNKTRGNIIEPLRKCDLGKIE